MSLKSPASELEGVFLAPEKVGTPKYEVPVRNSFALNVGPPRAPEGRDPAGESALVGAE